MPRLHLFELHDFHWCPKAIRDGLTDFLEMVIDAQDTYGPVRKKVLEVLNRSGAGRVVDLCSGGGGPWIRWLRKGEIQSTAILTDKYPNCQARDRLSGLRLPGLSYCDKPVDVAAVPPELTGFRTLFTSFHHFRPEQAKSVLQDAVTNQQPIGVFEFTSRTPKALLLMLFSPLAVWLLTAREKNVGLLRWLLTYPVPVIPLVVTIDGIVSCLRTYSVRELRAMADATGADNVGYTWLAGEEKGGIFPITYLIGYPGQR